MIRLKLNFSSNPFASCHKEWSQKSKINFFFFLKKYRVKVQCSTRQEKYLARLALLTTRGMRVHFQPKYLTFCLWWCRVASWGKQQLASCSAHVFSHTQTGLKCFCFSTVYCTFDAPISIDVEPIQRWENIGGVRVVVVRPGSNGVAAYVCVRDTCSLDVATNPPLLIVHGKPRLNRISSVHVVTEFWW